MAESISYPVPDYFFEGDRVVIVGSRSYSGQYYHYHGSILRTTDTQKNVPVMLDGRRNTGSGYGCFWFKPCEVALESDYINNEGESAMNTVPDHPANTVVTNSAEEKALGRVGAVKLSVVGKDTMDRLFKDDPLPTGADSPWYAAYQKYELGEFVAVRDNTLGMFIARVIEITEEDMEIPSFREVIGPIQMHDWFYRIHKRDELLKLKLDMRKRYQQMQELAIFQMAAEKDPEMAALFSRYSDMTREQIKGV